MVWLYGKWRAFRHPKQPHPSMEFYDKAWLKEADDANRREAILYLSACFVAFTSVTVLLMFA